MFYPYICTDSSSLVNVFPMIIALVYVGVSTCSLKRFISFNGDNCVQTVKITGNTCILCLNHFLNVFFKVKLALSTWYRHEKLCPVLFFHYLHT